MERIAERRREERDGIRIGDGWERDAAEVTECFFSFVRLFGHTEEKKSA